MPEHEQREEVVSDLPYRETRYEQLKETEELLQKARTELGEQEAAREKNEKALAEFAKSTSELVDKALLERVWTRIQERLGRKDSDTPLIDGFKVFKDSNGQDRWIAFYSNNFEDREKEFFSEKGFDRYVQRLDLGLVAMPKLRSWHVPGSEYGVADWVDRIGHFHVATGTYDDTELGRAGKAFDEKHASEMGVSHGLLHRLQDKVRVDGRNVYKDWNTFEISPLPFKRAANDLTAFAVESGTALKEAKMTEEKRKHLVEKFGEAAVVRMETATEQRGKEIEEYRAYKDFVHPDGDSEAVAHKEALESADQAFGELMPQLIEDAGEAVSAALQSVKAVKAMQTENLDLRKQVKELSEQVAAIRDGAPRASQSAKTIVKAEDALASKSQAGMTPEQEALSEALPGLYKQG